MTIEQQPGPASPEDPRKPMGWLLSYQAERDPDALALTFEGRTLTRSALDRAANRMARALEGRIGQDDVVALVMPNGLEHTIFAFAIWKLGASPLPISHKLPERELRGILELGGARLVLGPPAGALAGYETIPADFQPDPSLSDAPLPPKVAKHWKHMTSGGSSGRPKIIVDAAPSVADPSGLPGMLQIRGDDVIFQPGPLYHNAPFSQVGWALCCGSHVITAAKFDPLKWLQTVETHRPRWCCLVPTMMNRIWNVPAEVRARYDLSSVEVFMHMAAPCPEWLKAAWIDWLGPERIWEIFGATEPMGSMTIGGADWLTHRGSVGKPLSEVRILDENNRDVPQGEVGEIYFRRRAGMPKTFHYLGAEPRILDDVWATLGDMGRLDEEGYLYIADRRVDMIISGGVNIFPAEIEAALDAHPAIASCAVVGLPHADLGRAAHAIVELRPDAAAPAAAELEAFLAERLARYKLPYTYEIEQGVVRDDAGKVRRGALRDEREARLARGEIFTPLRGGGVVQGA